MRLVALLVTQSFYVINGMHSLTLASNKHVLHVFTSEWVPFSAEPLFGPYSGGTEITIRYNFNSHDVLTSTELTQLVNVTLNNAVLDIEAL